MKTLLLAGAAAVTLAMTVPASAQVGIGADPGGVGVHVGPLGVGVGPDYWGGGYRRWHRGYDAYNYAGDCRVMRERIVTPSGRVIFRTRRICD